MSPKHSPVRQGGAYTIQEFCHAHRLSRSKLYQMWDEGIGPRWMYVGTKRLISDEAAADWRREREQAAAAKLRVRPDDAKIASDAGGGAEEQDT
jgi:hypothetical protein